MSTSEQTRDRLNVAEVYSQIFTAAKPPLAYGSNWNSTAICEWQQSGSLIDGND
jgi:hypothetical protein